eukprot:6214774-Pleurochrysis_carterae.AAC.9
MMCTNERPGDVRVDETASVGWFVLRRVVGVACTPRATCRSEGGGRPRAPLRRVRACVARGLGERRREIPE